MNEDFTKHVRRASAMPKRLAPIIAVDSERPDAAVLARMGAALRSGELVAFPTETVYGLGADATNPEAVARIFAAKGRPATDPLIVHIARIGALEHVTGRSMGSLPSLALRLAHAFWPGPLTLVLPRGPAIPAIVSAGRGTVAVRLPAHAVACGLILAAGTPIAAPSANRFGHASPTTAAHVFADLGDRIEWILDAGPCAVGVESTIIDVTRDPPELLRPGGVAVEAIEAVAGVTLVRRERQVASENASATAPGQGMTHYAPHARMIVIEGDDLAAVQARLLAEIQQLAEGGAAVGALVPAEWAKLAEAAGARVWDLGPLGDDATAAQRLYAGLRALDDAAVAVIVATSLPGGGLRLALRDRLWRAASGTIIAV
jgi:L-threonylcarbamoyladenylate synthase